MSEGDYNIISVFVDAACRFPDSIALIQGGERITYNRLLDEVKGTAAAYRARGIGKGDRVLVLVPMSVALYRVVLALFYIGATPVFLDAWVSGKRLEACCKAVVCKAMIASNKLYWLSLIFSVLRKIPVRIKAGVRERSGTSIPAVQTALDDIALVTFTTGSTGAPKAAARTHAFLRAQLDALRPLMSPERDVTLTTLPIVVLLNLALGKTVVLPLKGFKASRPKDVQMLGQVLARHRVNSVVLSPALMQSLAGYPLPALRHITSGGGAVFPSLASVLHKRYPLAFVQAVYGSTEAEPISCIHGQDLAGTSYERLMEYGLPVGYASGGTAVAIIPFDNADTAVMVLPACAAGVAGEIVVAGAHVLHYYLNGDETNVRNKLVVDNTTWHRTGDAGRRLEDGSLYFLGRCNEVIEWDGRILFPLICCYCFKMESKVSEAALLRYNDQVVLVVESAGSLPEQVLREGFAAASLDGVVVRYVQLIPKDPRHHTKVDYAAVLKLLVRLDG